MANPNIEAAYFLVQIGQNKTNKKFRVKGSDFAEVATGPEMVWVQRGDDHYWTWYGQPKDLSSPDYSYRFNYAIDDSDPSDKKQPTGDGLINLSLYFGSPGPYQPDEWKNVRNTQRTFNDLDGKPFSIFLNSDLKEGDACRITHEGGDFEAWYVVEKNFEEGGDEFLQFKILYTRGEDGSGKDPERGRTDVKRTGSKPNADGTQVLKFDFYSKENAQPFSLIADTDWVWAQARDANNNWKHYKVSGKNFKELFRTDQPNFVVKSGSAYFNMKMHDINTAYQIEREGDGQTWEIKGNYTNTTLQPGSYFIPMEGCHWFRLENSRDAVFEFNTNFDTSTVTNMFKTFQQCRNFNAPVNHFDMSNCVTTQAMFYNCGKFNQSLAEWDLSSVTNARYMLYNCRGFNGSVTNLKFGPANCYEAFRNCTTFNQPMTGVDFSQVTRVSQLFYNCQLFNQPIGNLDFSSVDRSAGMDYTWFNCRAFNQDITEVTWGASPVFRHTFNNCVNLNHPKLSEAFPFPADTEEVTSPFYGIINAPNIANWTTPLPKKTMGLFQAWASFNQPVSHLDLSECENFSHAFRDCPAFNAADIGDLNVSGVQYLASLFYGSKNMKRDLSNWDVSECISIGAIFRQTAFRDFGISNWDVSNVERFDFAFDQSTVSSDLSSWDVSKGKNFTGMFSNWGVGFERDIMDSSEGPLDCKISNWDMRSATNIKNMFLDAAVSPYIANIHTNGWRLPHVKWDGVHSTGDEAQPWYHWNKTSGQGYESLDFIKGAPGIGMPVIEPGYEPTYTVLLGYSINSQIVASCVEKVAYGDGQGVKVIEPNRHDYSEVRVYYPSLSLYQMDFFERTSEGSLKFEEAPYESDFGNTNWSFVEPCGPHPELMNSPTNMAHLFSARRNQRTQLTNISGLQFINTSNVTNMSRAYCGQTSNNQGINNDIGLWDVGNVTCMDHMFACTSQPKFGSLKSWCVRHIPSEPDGFDYPGSNGIITEKPLWGLCPSDPDYVEPPENGVLPAGPWDAMNLEAVVQARLSENAGYFESMIKFKSFSVLTWRRETSSTGQWSDGGWTTYLMVKEGWDYVIGHDGSSFGTWDVGLDIDFPAADVSGIRDWARAFENSRQFNSEGMEHWKGVGSPTNIYKMFNNCRAFRQDLSNWDLRGARNSYRWDYATNVWADRNKPSV